MIKRIGWIGWLLLAFMAFALIYQLAYPPLVGLNDNGDFWRIMESYGLRYPSNYHSDLLTWNRYYDWDGRLLRIKMFPSSETLPVGLAVGVSSLISRHAQFDVMVLGLIQASIYFLGFILIVLATSHWHWIQRLLFYLVLGLVFSDVGYVSYFNSLYTESSGLIFLVVAMGLLALMVMPQVQDEKKCRRLLIWFFIASMLAITAKLQNVPSIILFAALGLYISRSRVGDKTARMSLRRSGNILLLCTILITVGFWGSYKFVPGIRTNNIYNMVFNEILYHSSSPEKDLNELGLDSSYMKYNKTFSWSSGINESIRIDVLNRVGDRGVLKFFIKHPSRFLDLARRGAKSAFVMRVPYLGNFQQGMVDTKYINTVQLDHDVREYDNRGSGYPYVLPQEFRSQVFDFWSGFKDKFFPKSLLFLMLCLIVNAVVIVYKWLKVDDSERHRTITAFHAVVIIGALFQFLLVLVGEAERDIVKHLFLFNLLSDVCLILLFAYAGHLVFLRAFHRRKVS